MQHPVYSRKELKKLERMSKLPIDEINFDQPRYDQSTYLGRLRHLIDVTDPFTLFHNQKTCEDALSVMHKVKGREAGWKDLDVEEVWKAKKIVSAVYHPDTEEIIPRHLRFSAFMPMNIVILSALVHPSQQGPMAGMFWQWVNQTYNMSVNYTNRNISSETGTAKLALSYAGAVTACLSITALGGKMANRVPAALRKFIPYTAVACANTVNVSLMRSDDYMKGIVVRDVETKEALPGHSVEAGKCAIKQIIVSRIVLPAPLIALPPVIRSFLFSPAVSFLHRRPHLVEPVSLGVMAFLLLAAAPASLALFPQETVMPVSKLEDQYQNFKNSKGNVVREVCFNKGL